MGDRGEINDGGDQAGHQSEIVVTPQWAVNACVAVAGQLVAVKAVKINARMLMHWPSVKSAALPEAEWRGAGGSAWPTTRRRAGHAREMAARRLTAAGVIIGAGAMWLVCSSPVIIGMREALLVTLASSALSRPLTAGEANKAREVT